MRGIGTSTDPTLVIGTKMMFGHAPFVITTPQFVILAPIHPNTLIVIPWCAGEQPWHERLVRKWMFRATPARISCRGDSRIALGGVVVPAHPGIPRTRQSTSPRLVSPAPQSSFRRKPESRGGTNDTQDTSTNQRSPIFKP